jgi:hypothetical protein
LLGGLIGAAIAGTIAWNLASGGIGQPGDWRFGSMRFIGSLATAGMFIGYFGVSRAVRGPRLTRDGFTLSYRTIAAKPDGYRELSMLRVEDVLAALRQAGYAPATEACDEEGTRRGPAEPTMTLAGCNVAIVDPKVRGWVRVHLPVPASGRERALGAIEIWSRRGNTAEELALFVIRALDGLVDDLHASRESSQLSEDPASLLTAGLGERRVG